MNDQHLLVVNDRKEQAHKLINRSRTDTDAIRDAL